MVAVVSGDSSVLRRQPRRRSPKRLPQPVAVRVDVLALQDCLRYEFCRVLTHFCRLFLGSVCL